MTVINNYIQFVTICCVDSDKKVYSVFNYLLMTMIRNYIQFVTICCVDSDKKLYLVCNYLLCRQ